MPFQNNVLAGASAQGGYQIQNSLRFRAANSAYLSRTSGASPTAQTKVTYSTWMKAVPSLFSGTQVGIVSSSANNGIIGWNLASGAGRIFVRNDATNDINFAGLFRDPSAWGHLVIAVDTTQATAADRVKVYWNGVAMTYVSGSYPTQNSNTYLNAASTAYRIMSDTVNGTYLDGYIANFYMIDGQALTPSSFGQTDATTGVWVPKAYSGTYGNNGFFLQFKDAASTTTIGYDTSGNSNNFTTSGISVTSGVTFDQMLDTPTNNYCVLSQINKSTSGGTVKNAGLTWNSGGGGATFYLVQSTFVLSGKCYWEYVIPTTITYHVPGIMRADQSPPSSGGSYYPGGGLGPANSVGYRSNDGDIYVGGSAVVAGDTPSAGDIIMFAFDAATGELWVGRNGTWLNSGNPAAGTGEVTTVSLSYSWVATLCDASTQDSEVNFGQRAFSYTPPSGFKALNTANLSVPSIKKPSLYMDATLRTGTGATASVSSLGFQPDLVWTKSRSAATNHNLFDSVRGVQNGIVSNSTAIEYADANTLTAFNSNGYTYGSDASSRGVNINTNTYVDWVWKKGVTPGFDIVTWTADGTSPRNISHSLGAVPKFIITKQRSPNVENWFTYHAELGATKNLRLDEAVAAQTQIGAWNDTAPTSTQFTTGNFANFTTNGNTLVAYLWSEVAGFSRFGSYVGTASADGPFVWCGFRPRWIMIKDATAANLEWRIYDTVRETYNEMGGGLEAGDAAAENYATSVRAIDVLSNGFKIRVSASGLNGSGTSYVFAAFAEAPFKYARAR